MNVCYSNGQYERYFMNIIWNSNCMICLFLQGSNLLNFALLPRRIYIRKKKRVSRFNRRKGAAITDTSDLAASRGYFYPDRHAAARYITAKQIAANYYKQFRRLYDWHTRTRNLEHRCLCLVRYHYILRSTRQQTIGLPRIGMR